LERRTRASPLVSSVASPVSSARPVHEEEPSAPWAGIAMRMMQVHLCILYFQSGLAKLNAGWFGGIALWHPRLVETGTPLAPEMLRDAPFLLVLIPVSLALFELFYAVFIWLRGFRHVTIVCAVLVHLSVGVLWEKLPFSLLMIAMNMAFLSPKLLDLLFGNLSALWAHGWRSVFDRA
ncbi:MAG: HTTM domain-containing protein, partial [bacterium]